MQTNNSNVDIVLPLRGGGGERNEVERTTKTKVQANTAITINTIIHNSVIAGVKKIVCNRFPYHTLPVMNIKKNLKFGYFFAFSPILNYYLNYLSLEFLMPLDGFFLPLFRVSDFDLFMSLLLIALIIL